MSSMAGREVQWERPDCPTCGTPAEANVSDGPRMGDDFVVYECVSCDRLVQIDASFEISWGDSTADPRAVQAVRTAPSSVKPPVSPSA